MKRSVLSAVPFSSTEISEAAKAEKYIELAAQLGNGAALEYMGDKHLAEGKYDVAALEFKADSSPP